MKQCVKVYELVTDSDKNVKKVFRGIYKNMTAVSKAFQVHNKTVSNICHGRRKWVEVNSKTYTFKFTDKDYTKAI